MKVSEIIRQPEGRRLEFKEKLPSSADLAKTILAFANDAGGDLFIGIRNEPREIIGIPEDELLPVEEKISNILFNQCHPVIVPEISIHGENENQFIRVKIFRGSNFPYHLKSKGIREGTYIRVGSSSRQADDEIIRELERQKRNISFDSEPVFDLKLNDLNLEPFKAFYKQKTGEEVDVTLMKKSGLIRDFQGEWIPSYACILFSENPERAGIFPYSKVECARFKGHTPDVFIDQKTIDENIALQPEAAFNFVLRHINKGALTRGVYTESRWEYPVNAIREVIRNAVVHRDYSLTGKDIKVAIYDDMVEITSPGKLLPSIDFNDMEARQSDIRNKVIAPVFKRTGMIDQWGNGLKLIADELKSYPEIEFKWKETGLQFQVQFVIRDFETKISTEKQMVKEPDLKPDLQQEIQQMQQEAQQEQAKSGPELGPSIKPELMKELGPELALEKKRPSLYSHVLKSLIENPLSKQEISIQTGSKIISGYLKKILKKLHQDNLIEFTIPENPNHPAQKHKINDRGRMFLKIIEETKSKTT